MKGIALLVIVCGGLIVSSCQAQAPSAQRVTPCAVEKGKTADCKPQSQSLMSSRPSAEEMQKQMDTAMGAMVPMMGRMAEVMMEAQLKIAARPETATSIAIFKKNLYEELQKKGFTPEQALQITLATAIPAAAPMGK